MIKTIKLAGPAGFGLKSGGQLFSKIMMAHGFAVRDYNEYPSLVRGGHNTYQLSFSDQELYAPYYMVDIFFAIAPKHWSDHLVEFSQNTLIFVDEELDTVPKDLQFIRLPLKELSQLVGSSIATNTLCLGVTAYLYQLNGELCKKMISQQYPTATDLNSKAFDLGYKFAQDSYQKYQKKLDFPKSADLSKELIDGNEAFGWGFLAGKGDFYAAYPMTPSTGALHFLAAKSKEYQIHVVHPEDEIAGASIAAGAAFAGARAAVGTSGGGFALMNETISFCGVAEIGMTFYLVSRPGPATGLPTWTSQGDLLYAIYAGHGEFPKVVIAPSSSEESFEFAATSLNLAARLQTPVIVISDKYLAESAASQGPLKDKLVEVVSATTANSDAPDYKRYALSVDGVSPLSLPGTAGHEYIANSYEHNEQGFATEEAAIARAQMDKRHQKLSTALSLCPQAELQSSSEAKTLVVTWGAVTPPVKQALNCHPRRHDFAHLIIKTLWPIDPSLKNTIAKYQKVIVIENNQTNQLVTLLKSQFDFNPTTLHQKNDGRPYFPEEITTILDQS